MATVGEIVQLYTNERGSNFWNNPVTTLQALGIWDAEMLYGRAVCIKKGKFYIRMDPQLSELDTQICYNDHVRVILLPCEEEKK